MWPSQQPNLHMPFTGRRQCPHQPHWQLGPWPHYHLSLLGCLGTMLCGWLLLLSVRGRWPVFHKLISPSFGAYMLQTWLIILDHALSLNQVYSLWLLISFITQFHLFMENWLERSNWSSYIILIAHILSCATSVEFVVLLNGWRFGRDWECVYWGLWKVWNLRWPVVIWFVEFGLF